MASTRKVRIVCISDTHNAAPGHGYVLPPGDILIHAGDLTNQGTAVELAKAHAFLAAAPHAVKIVIAGNHDLALESNSETHYDGDRSGWAQAFRPRDESDDSDNPGNITYLCHSGADIFLPPTYNADASVNQNGVRLRVFGSPYSPDRGGQNHTAFQDAPGEIAEIRWSQIPPDMDVLVTHTPPAGILDASAHWTQGGCDALRNRLEHARPLLHVCGHCHEGRGAAIVRWESNQSVGQGEGPIVTPWQDPGIGSKKLSLFSLASPVQIQRGLETAVANASITARSHGRGPKLFNKPIVVDVLLPTVASP